jgi:hypothetical protein
MFRRKEKNEWSHQEDMKGMWVAINNEGEIISKDKDEKVVAREIRLASQGGKMFYFSQVGQSEDRVYHL